jgi:hypothetical protein
LKISAHFEPPARAAEALRCHLDGFRERARLELEIGHEPLLNVQMDIFAARGREVRELGGHSASPCADRRNW